MHSDLTEHLKSFHGKKILVVGDVGLDRYHFGTSTRICPEAPVPVFKPTRSVCRPGLAGNVAVNIASLGGAVRVCSIIGDDQSGFEFIESLEQAGIQGAEKDIAHSMDRETTVKNRYYIDRHMLLRVDAEDVYPFPKDLMKRFTSGVRQEATQWADLVVIQDYGKGLVTRELVEALLQSGKKILVDPSSHQKMSLYQGVDYFKPNLSEWEILSHVSEVGLSPWGAMQKLGFRGIIITQGAAGVSYYEGLQTSETFPSHLREVADVCGCGDTFTAALALGIASTFCLSHAVQIANAASGVVVGKFGTASVNLEELKALLKETYGSGNKTDSRTGCL